MDADRIGLGVDSLAIGQVGQYAGRCGDFIVELPPAACLRVNQSNVLKHRLIDTKHPIYGVTTRFGDSATRQVSPGKAVSLQSSLVLYHLNGSGAEADPATVRATMLIRANCLARGYSGIRLEVIQLLIDCMQADVLPVVPERGSVGASGDLVPLCYMTSMLTGLGDVCWNGSMMAARLALEVCGLAPVTLEAKEALALINGTSFMSAYAVLAIA